MAPILAGAAIGVRKLRIVWEWTVLGLGASALRWQWPSVATHAGIVSGWIPESLGMALAAALLAEDAFESALLALGGEWLSGVIMALKSGYPWDHRDLALALMAGVWAWVIRSGAAQISIWTTRFKV